ncbi:ABC transporter ATP-binding protein [Gelatiniphilus marinus]|uniref:ABC transporter ATP-binding protein n=1 Tax=Gelatiniphilus marinus TaxID=1759464 RepID=A0ABW5JUR4_9FLAO
MENKYNMTVSINELEFFYPSAQILKGVTTEINQGEFVVLFGPNGSGKSTLMKCMNKILNPQVGYVEVEGKPVEQYSHLDLAKRIAYVPQNEVKVTGIKVFDMILSGRKPYISWKPSDKDYAIVTEVIESLKLEKIAMKDISALSGGQQQMVYIARAIAQEPKILLLDEPTSALDVKHQLEIMELLKSLSDKGITIIVTLHDINLATKYADKYLMLQEGKLYAEGCKKILTEHHLEMLYGVKIKILNDKDDFFVVPYSLS